MMAGSNHDKHLTVWTALLVSLIWTNPWSCEAFSCPGTEWREERSQDLESISTTGANASLNLQAVYTTLDRDACERLCCQTSGNCSAGGDPPQSRSSNGTCYLYNCASAQVFCVYTAANGTNSVLSSLPLEKPRRNPGILASGATDVVGDGTQSKGRKGVLSEVLDDLPLKHDNTSVKPRKGVLKEHSVNGRKGVGKDEYALSTELFAEDLGVGNGSFENTSNPQTTVISLVEDVTNETHSTLNTLNTITTQSLQGFDYGRNSSELPGEDQANITIVLLSNSTLRSTTTLQISPSSEATDSSKTHTISTVPANKEAVLVVTEASNIDAFPHEGKNSIVTQDGDDLNWEMNQSNTAMHLVIGLVLGLMVLLTVIGIVAKRVHDSWQRRHYHRMDFLIDGMYHGNP